MSNLVSTFKFKGSSTAYTVRDANTLLNLNTTLKTEVETTGTYNGNEVANNTVFTSDDGSFKEFTKHQESGDTSFVDTGVAFPNSSNNFFTTKVTQSVGGVDTDFYMAVGGDYSYTLSDGGDWTLGGNPSATTDKFATPLYNNGAWVVKNAYGNVSSSTNNGQSWTVQSSGDVRPATDMGVAGNYFWTSYEGQSQFSLSDDGVNWTTQYSNKTLSMVYDGTQYVSLRDGKIYTTTTPTDDSSWPEVTVTTAWWGSGRTMRYHRGKFYMLSSGYGNDGYQYVLNVATNPNSWSTKSQVFAGNSSSRLLFIEDLIFVERDNGELWQSDDDGETFVQLSNGNGKSTVVGNELWEIYGGKIYALNPNARWVYSLTNIGSLTDIAEAGNGIKFMPPQNFDVFGTPTLSEHVLSNTTDTDYLQITSPSSTFAPSTSAWEITTRVKTPADVSSQKSIFDNPTDQRGFRLGISVNGKWQLLISNGSYWLNGGSHEGSHTVQPDTVYWLKAGFTGAAYYIEYSTDGTNFTPDLTSSFSDAIEQNSGIYLMTYSNTWDGEIYLDETSISIGGSVWTTPYSSSTKTKIAADILMPASTPDSSLNGYAGQIAIYGGNAYICVDGSNTWKQFTS